MQSRWNDLEASKFQSDLLSLRAYSSRLLGQEASLVQHGGGNTSVKVPRKNLFGEIEEILFVKGSGWDLSSIEPQGFAPVKMSTLLRMAELDTLNDTDMVREQRAAMINPSAPTPSVEAILHAIIPFQFVDHTHSDAVVTITNTSKGPDLARGLFRKMLILPYVMPGFVLARQIFEATRDLDWNEIEGIVLLNHGVFTFHHEARVAYETMIRTVTIAEDFLKEKKVYRARTSKSSQAVNTLTIAKLRKRLSREMGSPVLVRLDASEEAVGFSQWERAAEVSRLGTITPDHVIHIKPQPMIFQGEIEECVGDFSNRIGEIFTRNKFEGLSELDRCPRWAIWPEFGTINVATTARGIRVVDDIVRHTRRCMQIGDALGGWKPVSEADLFAVEYWELEQAKLKVQGSGKPIFQGKIAVVTGGASGIGKGIAEKLHTMGAAVAILDLKKREDFSGDGRLSLICDITSEASIQNAIQEVVIYFGGIDILVTNAGTFPPGKSIDATSEADFTQILDVNLTGHWRCMKAAIPFLKEGLDPNILVVGSKNVPAPGPGASAYSSAKAGLTQLARVAALELAPHGIRVNTIHPDAVFDTGLWNEEVISNRAKHYGMSVEQYKRKNLLKTEITTENVAQLVAAIVGPAFAKTTGEQIAIDGGNDRVI